MDTFDRADHVLYRLRHNGGGIRLSSRGRVVAFPGSCLTAALKRDIAAHRDEIAVVLQNDPIRNGQLPIRYPNICVTCGLRTPLLDRLHECVLCTDRRRAGSPPAAYQPLPATPRICPNCHKPRETFYRDGWCVICGPANSSRFKKVTEVTYDDAGMDDSDAPDDDEGVR